MRSAKALAKQLLDRANLIVDSARASILFRRFALLDRVIARGYVRVESAGTIELGRYVDFRGGILPTELIVHPGATLSFGESTAVNYGVSIECSKSISFGRLCMVSKMVRIRDNDGEKSAPIVIGNEVWIAHGAMIEPGVTIGDGAVISAGSVITADVPAHTMAIGNPARNLPLSYRPKAKTQDAG